MDHLPKIKFVWKTCNPLHFPSSSLCHSATTPSKSQSQPSSWSTKKERHSPMLPSNWWNSSRCRRLRTKTLVRARVSTGWEDPTANTPVKKSKKQSSAYYLLHIDPKRLRCQCSLKTLRHSQEELITLEEVWLRKERRRRKTHWRRNGTDCPPQNQIGRANWRKTNQRIGCFSQQNRLFQSIQRLVCQVLPALRHQAAWFSFWPARTGWPRIDRLSPKLILIYLSMTLVWYKYLSLLLIKLLTEYLSNTF